METAGDSTKGHSREEGCTASPHVELTLSAYVLQLQQYHWACV